jgi:hypothetical protein
MLYYIIILPGLEEKSSCCERVIWLGAEAEL